MSDLTKISEDLHHVYSQWAAMLRDRDRCAQKIENLKAELAIAESQEKAHELASFVMMMTYTASQYQQQIDRFPEKVAELKAKLTFLVVAPAEFVRRRAHSNC